MCQIEKTRAHWMVCLALVFVLSACTMTQPASPTPAQPPETAAAPTDLPVSDSNPLIAIQSITASAQMADSPPDMAVDRNLETAWNSGGGAPQWLELDLGSVYQLEALTLHVVQYPNGKTHHRLWGAVEAGNYSLLTEFSGETADKQALTFQPDTLPVIRYLKIETTESPSWVAWAEIEVHGKPQQTAPAGQQAQVIFYNGYILTMNDNQPVAQAIAIADGKIVAVGADEQVLELKSGTTRLVDLQGKTLMPGFVDAHAHLFGASGLPFGEAQAFVLKNGITSIGELYVDQALLDGMVAFERSGELKMRVSMYLNYNNACGEPMGDWFKQYPPTRTPGALLRVAGVKIYSDGGSCNVPAYSFDFPGLGMGDLYFTPQEMLDVMRDLDSAGYQMAIHALGDRAVDMLLESYTSLFAGGENDLRHRIDHNAIVRPDQMNRYAASKAAIVIFGAYPVCRLTDTQNPIKFVVPSEYQSWEWPWRHLMDANPNSIIAWHSDAPVFGMQNFVTSRHLYAFVTRAEVAEDGHVCQPPPYFEAGKIRVEEALRLMTINAAYALNLEQEVGSLEPGKYADLILLSDNPLTMPAADLHRLQVQMTMVGGETLFCDAAVTAMCP
jgi:predicted amidohydrolase YtcJ